MRDLDPCLICHLVELARGEMISSILPPVVGGRTDPKDMRVEELALLLTVCSIWKNRPWTFHPDNIVRLKMLAGKQGSRP